MVKGALSLGLLVVFGVTSIWSLLAGLNIKSTPGIPWSFLAMAVVLWLFWKYMNGSGPPVSTRGTRREWLRAGPVPEKKRVIGYMAAGLFGITLLELIVLTTRLIDFTPGQVDQIERASAYPAITVIALMLMASLVAGVVEEIGFRGVMQRPLELAYGPSIGITVTAFVFALIHLPNATIAPHIIPIFFAGSLGWGLLAYLNESIRPGIVVHFLVDAVAFFWAWLNLDTAKSLGSESIIRDGFDAVFLIQLLFFGASVFVFIALLRRLRG
ncbi:MAG: CPBP family intramembrane metalloprotease [Pyrinomonadaceae bacterium]|nr:CPBP family intramembrane metalloprotease [Pyrinomonadaceae bacterium]